MYIILDVLVCSIAVYFYESCMYFGEPEGQMISKKMQRYYTLKCLIRDLLSNVFVSPKFWLTKVFDLLCGQGNETSTNIVWYLYSFCALFVLYEAVLDNKAAFNDSSGKTKGIEVKDERNCGYVEMEELRWAILHVLNSLINESKDESYPGQQEHSKIQQNLWSLN